MKVAKRQFAHVFACICAGIVLARDGNLRSQTIELSPRNEAEEQFRRIDKGDPRAVAIGMDWLSQSLVKADDPAFRAKLFAALATVDEFRLEQAGPDLVALYRVAGNAREVRDGIVRCACEIGTPKSRRFLESLRDDDTISPASHVQIYGALLKLGDESASQMLMETERRWIDQVGEPSAPPEELAIVPFVLRRLDDDTLAAELQRQLANRRDPAKQRELEHALDYLRSNRMSVDELFKVITQPTELKIRHRVFTAFFAIGNKAGLDAIPRLQAVVPTTLPATRPNEGPLHLDINETRDETIKTIRRLHWRELLHAGGEKGS